MDIFVFAKLLEKQKQYSFSLFLTKFHQFPALIASAVSGADKQVMIATVFFLSDAANYFLKNACGRMPLCRLQA